MAMAGLLRAPMQWRRNWLATRAPLAPSYGTPIGGYAGNGPLRRWRRAIFLALAMFVFVYGFSFALYGRFLFVQFLAPIGFLALIAVWVLPEMGRAPTRILCGLFSAYLFAVFCWPDYLAVAFKFLPWFTAIRLIGVPMLVTLLICLSISAAFRAKLADIVSTMPWVWKLMVVYFVMGLVTLPMSKSPVNSINKLMVAQMTWTSVFFVGCYYFSFEGAAKRFVRYLIPITLLVCLIGMWEWQLRRLPWAGHIPSFLAVQDENVINILNGTARAATGLYRVQSKFTTSLGLGEFLGMTTPFIIHLMVVTPKLWVRLGCAAMLPLIFETTVATDSRLASIGFLMSCMLYLLAWAALRWRDRKDSLFGPAIVLAYPALFALFVALSFVWRRLEVMVWGGGATTASSEARRQMWQRGVPMVIKNPIGHGWAQGAEALGYTSGGFVTIDSYYLSLLLDIGIVGFGAFFGMIGIVIWRAGRTALESFDPEMRLLIPATIALINFTIGKYVFSQTENHSLPFMLMAMTVALTWRHQQRQAGGAGLPATARV